MRRVDVQLNWSNWMRSHEVAELVVISPKGGRVIFKKSKQHLRNLMLLDKDLHQRLLRHKYKKTMTVDVGEMKLMLLATKQDGMLF